MRAVLQKVLSAMVFVSIALLAIPSQAGETRSTSGPQYSLPKDAKKCVRDTAFMRRNHMNLLKHQRDETMHKGIRTKTFSLKNCINCHVTKDDTGKAIKVSNPKHFCAACHKFAAVKLDCFECHRSTPQETGDTSALQNIPGHENMVAKNTKGAEALRSYLEGVTQ